MTIVTISARPDLAPIVARWRTEAFGYPGGWTVDDLTAALLAPQVGLEETFVVLEDDVPVGTASLTHEDLPSRSDLTPWLAGVYVEPPFRGRGYATILARQVEHLAAAAGVSVLWLYTATAEPLYARLGWQRMGVEQERGQPVTLMRRILTAVPAGILATASPLAG